MRTEMFNSHSITLLAGVAYFVYYMCRMVEKPDIYSGSKLKRFLLTHCGSLKAAYWPTVWCIGAHMQTALPTLIQSKPHQIYRREKFTTQDGGELSLHWVDNHDGGKKFEENNRPTVIILPGLTGCSSNGYVLHMVDSVVKLGYRAVVFNNRGLGGAELKTPRTYCAANTEDLKEVVDHTHNLYPHAPLIAAGASLGGIILFNYLAKEGSNTPLVAGFTVSTAWDMFESTKELERPINRWCLNYPLARSLSRVLQNHCSMFQNTINECDLTTALNASTIREFDASFTAKLFGYADVDEYYADACLYQKLHQIKIPTVCINSRNDPFSPVHALPIKESCSQENVALIVTSNGGHLGFLSSLWPSGKSLWHSIFSEVIDAFFKQRGDITIEEKLN